MDKISHVGPKIREAWNYELVSVEEKAASVDVVISVFFISQSCRHPTVHRGVRSVWGSQKGDH